MGPNASGRFEVLFAQLATALAGKGIADALDRLAEIRGEATRVFGEQRQHHEAFVRSLSDNLRRTERERDAALRDASQAHRRFSEQVQRADRFEVAYTAEVEEHEETRAKLKWYEAGCPDPIPEVTDTAECPVCQGEHLVSFGLDQCYCPHCLQTFNVDLGDYLPPFP